MASPQRSRTRSSSLPGAWPSSGWASVTVVARHAPARRGLLASPFDERLYRLLLRAADAEGNPAGVESVMTELLRLLGDAHPQTADLYLALTRRVPAAGRPLARL